MRILLFSHYYYPEGNAPAVRGHEHCKRWAERGHDVTVITCAPNVPNGVLYPGYKNRVSQSEVIDGVRVIRVWSYLAANAGALRRILNYLSFMVASVFRSWFVARPDVILATSPQFFCGWAGVIASRARFRRIPFVLEIRDIWPESIETVAAMKKGVVLKLLERMERTMYRAANEIVCVGNGYREKLVERGVGSKKIRVITNGVDLNDFTVSGTQHSLREELGLADKFLVGYIGTIGMACGLDCVLDAAEELKRAGENDIRFLLVGEGARYAELREMAVDRGITNVVFTGRLSRKHIPELLRTIDACLVHLARKELFKSVLPSKIFEAMGCGKPVIIGVDGEARSLVEAASAGVPMTPESVEELICATKRLRDDSNLAEAGMNGRRWVEKFYDRDQLAADYLEFLEAFLRQTSGRHPVPIPNVQLTKS